MDYDGTRSFRPDGQIGEIDWCRWHECKGCGSDWDLGDRDAAVRRLRDWSSQASALFDLRRIAATFGDTVSLPCLDDPAVIGVVAELLVSQRIRVCKRPQVLIRLTREAAAVAAPAAPAAAPRRPVPSAPLPLELEPNIDHAAMAKVLREAAAHGVPFCEECEKAKAQRTPAEAVA